MKTYSDLFEKADNEILSVTSKDTGEQLPVLKKKPQLKLKPNTVLRKDPEPLVVDPPTREIDLPDYKADKNRESENDATYGADADNFIANIKKKPQHELVKQQWSKLFPEIRSELMDYWNDWSANNLDKQPSYMGSPGDREAMTNAYMEQYLWNMVTPIDDPQEGGIKALFDRDTKEAQKKLFRGLKKIGLDNPEDFRAFMKAHLQDYLTTNNLALAKHIRAEIGDNKAMPYRGRKGDQDKEISDILQRAEARVMSPEQRELYKTIFPESIGDDDQLGIWDEEEIQKAKLDYILAMMKAPIVKGQFPVGWRALSGYKPPQEYMQQEKLLTRRSDIDTPKYHKWGGKAHLDGAYLPLADFLVKQFPNNKEIQKLFADDIEKIHAHRAKDLEYIESREKGDKDFLEFGRDWAEKFGIDPRYMSEPYLEYERRKKLDPDNKFAQKRLDQARKKIKAMGLDEDSPLREFYEDYLKYIRVTGSDAVFYDPNNEFSDMEEFKEMYERMQGRPLAIREALRMKGFDEEVFGSWQDELELPSEEDLAAKFEYYGLDNKQAQEKIRKFYSVLAHEGMPMEGPQMQWMKSLLTHRDDNFYDIMSTLTFDNFEQFMDVNGPLINDSRYDIPYDGRFPQDMRTIPQRMSEMLALLFDQEEYLDYINDLGTGTLTANFPQGTPLMNAGDMSHMHYLLGQGEDMEGLVEYGELDDDSPEAYLYNGIIEDWTRNYQRYQGREPDPDNRSHSIGDYYAQQLDNALEAAREAQYGPEERLHRVVNGPHARALFDTLEEGDEFTDEYFGAYSTRILDNWLSDDDKSLVMQIDSDLPVNIVDLSRHRSENERLMNRNMRYRVIGKNTGGIYNRLILEPLGRTDEWNEEF